MFGLDDAARGAAQGVVGGIFEIGSKILDRVLPDPAAKAAALLELQKLQQTGDLAVMANETSLALGQMKINEIEAASEGWFKGGWRPAVGWTCVGGLSYQLLFRPIVGWLMENLVQWTRPPALDIDTLMTLLFGMLGLGGYRTFEKYKGVSK